MINIDNEGQRCHFNKAGPEAVNEPGLVSLVSTDAGWFVFATAAAAVGGSEAPRGHLDSGSSRRSLARTRRDAEMT